MDTYVQLLRDIIGHDGKLHVDLGPEGHKLTEEELAKLIVESLEEIMRKNSEPMQMAFFPMGSEWDYEYYGDDFDINCWRIFEKGTQKYCQTVATLKGQGNNNEQLCKEICIDHNARIWATNPQILKMEPSGVELLIHLDTDGKWRFTNAVHNHAHGTETLY